MGLLTELKQGAAKINPATLISENKDRAAELYRGQLIDKAGRLFDESYSRYSGLGKLLESDDPRDRYKGALTLTMMDKTANYIENMKAIHGEAVVSTSLGALTPRVMDVIRIFYPNQIATELVDIQPLDGMVGSVFILKPRFSNSLPANTPGRVLAGDEIFVNRSYYYASEVTGQTIGTGDGTAVTFAGSMGRVPIRKGSVQVTTVVGGNASVATDDSAGGISGPDVTTGTVDYTTGAVSVTFSAAVTNLAIVLVNHLWDSEANGEGINEIEFDMSVFPIEAKIHPLKFKYSVVAGLAASAHLAIDVQDTLAELAGQFMKAERDNRLIRLISDNAPYLSILDFDATPSTYFDRQSKYADIDLKINEAESQIQLANGRGGISWVVAGSNAANIFRQTKGFMPAPIVAPIGAHIIGYLRDGTVPLIKSLGVIGTNDYIVGYKGYMAGDASIILAEWIPIYFTPVWQAPYLQNQQGLLSMYDLFLNRSAYLAKGKVTNYAA
jgi:Major capsid protein Gp23